MVVELPEGVDIPVKKVKADDTLLLILLGYLVGQELGLSEEDVREIAKKAEESAWKKLKRRL